MTKPIKTDIVDRLRDHDHCADVDVDEAAGEIVQLRLENTRLRLAVDRLLATVIESQPMPDVTITINIAERSKSEVSDG